MNRIPVLDVKECQALAEQLGFVIGLDSEPLLGMHASEPLLQFRQKIPVHGAASLEICPVAHDRCQPAGFVAAFMAASMMRTATPEKAAPATNVAVDPKACQSQPASTLAISSAPPVTRLNRPKAVPRRSSGAVSATSADNRPCDNPK